MTDKYTITIEYWEKETKHSIEIIVRENGTGTIWFDKKESNPVTYASIGTVQEK